MVIGLTGGIASGKSEAARILEELGAYVVDVDAVSRALTLPCAPGSDAIRAAFGDACFDGGILNRGRLAEMVFASPDALRALNSILHPMIIERSLAAVRAALAERPERPVVLDAPLLIECGLADDMDEVWVVTAPLPDRLARLRERSGMGKADALRRMENQYDDARRLARATRRLQNNAGIAELRKQVLAAWRSLPGNY